MAPTGVRVSSSLRSRFRLLKTQTFLRTVPIALLHNPRWAARRLPTSGSLGNLHDCPGRKRFCAIDRIAVAY